MRVSQLSNILLVNIVSKLFNLSLTINIRISTQGSVLYKIQGGKYYDH